MLNRRGLLITFFVCFTLFSAEQDQKTSKTEQEEEGVEF